MTTTSTTTTTALRRSAAFLTAALALTTATAVRAPASPTVEQPTTERPCFLRPARWNTALDGPVPTCPTPVARGRAGEAPGVATLADCLDPARRPVVRTCPYPITSGDQFSDYLEVTRHDDTSGPGGL